MGLSEDSPCDLPRQLAVEKQLLAEEKYIVSAMKRILEEQNSLQVERLQMMSHLHELQRRANPPPVMTQPQPQLVPLPPPPPPTLESEFDLPMIEDNDLLQEMNLNLTIPQHPYYVSEPVSHDHDEDEFEIEMGMFMNMTTDR